jgi:ribosomal 30S subunit maturation factor RimM
MSREELIPAGEVLKVHGLEGGLVIRFRELFCFPAVLPDFVFLVIDGLPVPFPVEEAEAFGECSWLFFFEDVTTRDRAMRYRGAEVMLEKKYLPEEAEELPHALAGYRFRDETSGVTGEITGYRDIPGNPLFEVQTAAGESLVPAAETFIRETDHEKKKVIFALPDGIFDPEEL